MKKDHLTNKEDKVEPDAFILFLDKISNISHSKELNNLILERIAHINIDALSPKILMNTYQHHSVDFKFEEGIRMGEIKKFAKEVIPKSSFIFDRYKVSNEDVELRNEVAGLSDDESGAADDAYASSD